MSDRLNNYNGEGLLKDKQHLSYFFNCLGDCEIIPVKDFTKNDYIFFQNFIKGDENKNERTQQTFPLPLPTKGLLHRTIFC